MSKRGHFIPGTSSLMEGLLSKVEKANELKRVQVILLGSKGLSAQEIGLIVGLKEPSIWRLWKRYREEGISMIRDKRGQNRGKAYLSLENEINFLSPFKEEAKSGKIVTVQSIRDKHEMLLSKTLSPGATYNLLRRHGWRKIVPRPEHPKYKPEDAERFKEAIFPPGYDPYESVVDSSE